MTAPATQGGHDRTQPVEAKAAPGFKGDPYLLDSDPATGEKLPAVNEQVVADHEGRELRFASEKNLATFRAEPAKHLAKVDAKLIEQQGPSYALEACPVSAEKLGGMGKPVDFVFKNRLVRFCCLSCRTQFLEDPAKYVAKLDAAVIETQGKKYAVDRCVVSGEEFGGEMGEPVDYVIGSRLVRLCCVGCVKKLRKDPLKYLAMLDALSAAEVHDGGGEQGGHDHRDQ